MDLQTLDTVRDIARHIASTRGEIIEDWTNIELHLDGCLLPEDEPSNILQTGDVVEVVQKIRRSLQKPVNGQQKLNSSITNQSSKEGGPLTKKPRVKEERSSLTTDSLYSEEAFPKALKARPVVLRRRATSKTKSIYDLSSEDKFDEDLESSSFVRRRATSKTKSIYDLSSEEEFDEALESRSYVRRRATRSFVRRRATLETKVSTI